MASIRRVGSRTEIRECVRTERGPRQRILASFRGPLSPEILDEAERRARRPFHREALMARAAKAGVPVTRQRRCDEARALLARLNGGGQVDPTVVALLRDALARLEAEPVPEHLEDAAEWVGQPEAARGEALRGLLRVADRIVQSREPVRERPEQPFPRFDSERAKAS